MVATSSDSRDARVEERRNQILDAAATVFARKGYHVATMDDIVKESKLSKGAIYWYFKSKKEIFLELARRFSESDRTRLEEAVNSGKTFVEKVQGLFQWLISTENETGCDTEQGLVERRLIAEFWQQGVVDPEVQAIFKAGYHYWFDFGEKIIQEAVDAGEIRPVDAAALSTLIVAITDGVSTHWLLNVNRTPSERVFKTMLEVFMRGLAK
jgi:AcrR family transcriptional regulator